jgi:indole-3-glycerol phosphate synthase
VAESGIKSGLDLKRLRDAGFDACLVGEQLMASADPGAALRLLLEQAS